MRSGSDWRTRSDRTSRSGVGVLVLTRWHSGLASGRTPAGPQARAQDVRLAALRPGCRYLLAVCQSCLAMISSAKANASNNTVLRGSLSNKRRGLGFQGARSG